MTASVIPARAAGAATQASEPSPPATTSPSGSEDGLLDLIEGELGDLKPVAAQAVRDLVRLPGPESGFASSATVFISSDYARSATSARELGSSLAPLAGTLVRRFARALEGLLQPIPELAGGRACRALPSSEGLVDALLRVP